MIELALPCQLDGDQEEPFVVKLGATESPVYTRELVGSFAPRVSCNEEVYQTAFGKLTISSPPGLSLEGDVAFVDPVQGRLHRWFRRGDTQNTLLITERCDQLCIMCSQPPKKSHTDLFDHFFEACLLADKGADIGLSGGEPTLFKGQIFDLIDRVRALRPEIRFHILTNAQHFEDDDIPVLAAFGEAVCWGVPLYSTEASEHDDIVGKQGAHAALTNGLARLVRSGSVLELRTVVMRQNMHRLPELARWVRTHLPGVDCWAVMQLERQGFARTRWAAQFFDHSNDFSKLAEALSYAAAYGLPVTLYNFPRCTVPEAYRDFAPSTISDWKRAYFDDCEACSQKVLCGGLFAWHKDSNPYAHWGAL
ncbi:MAG TPA: His-Xaa-Ser system radical SAM maturase HxsC [Oceanicaulis sp.]|nr:His-Xaa-Ser system radical SAM maturase HxsC [Oceanicaulis sp.]